MLFTADGSQKSEVGSNSAGQAEGMEKTVVDDNVAVRRSKQRKCVIAAATCVVLCCLIVIGVLVGIKLYWLMTSDITKYTLQFNDGKRQIDENITRSVKENFVEFHVVDPDDENVQYWVLQDFNRYLQVMKYQSHRDAACFILPLNISRAYPMNSKANNKTSCSNNDGSKRVTLYFEMSTYPIKETSILGSRGTDLCADLSAFWVFPVSPYEVVENVHSEDGKTSCGKQYDYSVIPVDKANRERRWSIHIHIHIHIHLF